MEPNFEITQTTRTGETEIVNGLEVFVEGAIATTTTYLAYVHEPKDPREVIQGEAATSRLYLKGHLIDPVQFPSDFDYDAQFTARFLSGSLANVGYGVFQLQPIIEPGSTALTEKMGQRITGFFTANTR